MPLCPQITNTAVTVTSTGMTTTSVTPVVTATSTDVAVVQASADGKNVITYSSASPSGSGTREVIYGGNTQEQPLSANGLGQALFGLAHLSPML